MFGLVPHRATLNHSHALAVWVCREDALVPPHRVVNGERTGRTHDGATRPVVLLERHARRVWVHREKSAHRRRTLCSLEGVNRLVVVSNHGEPRGAGWRKQLQQLQLKRVRVLEFVDQHVRVGLAQRVARRWHRRQNAGCDANKVDHVKGAALA
eukprot:scaffold5747_cov128-Isochrysis_galbana.AAC.3